MSFDANDKQIGDLLNKAMFSIPRNQRRYVWNRENWSELLEDVIFSCKSGKTPHFLGSVVLEDNGKKEGISRYTIIDGQQRLTTITLLLIAIMKLFNEKGMKNEFLGTLDYVITKNNVNEQKPILNSDYHVSLEKLIWKIEKLGYRDKITIDAFVDCCILTDKDKNIGEAIKYFYFSISEEIRKNKDGIKRSLLQIRDAVIDMVLVSIVSSSEEDSYTIFEILNARGQELEDYELLKNYIMRYIDPVEKRDPAKEKWEEMERTLGTSIKKFINHYAWHKFGAPEGVTAYHIIQKNTKGRDVNNLLDDILIKAKYYTKFIRPTIGADGNCNDYEHRIYSYFKRKRQEQFRPVLLSLLHQKEMGALKEEEYKDVLNYLYNFFVCYTIIGEEKSNKLRDTVIKYAVLLENEFSKSILLEFGKSIKKKIPSYNWFEHSFENLGWSNHTEIFKDSRNKQRVQVTLEIIEQFVSQRFEIGEFTIEHILPDSQGEENAHIGNLIPLEAKLNKQCEDKPLDEKYKIYEKSNFVTTRGISRQYGNKKFNPENRTKYLAKLIYNNILELKQLNFD